LGASFELTEHLTGGLDYWSYDYSDIIIQQSAEAIFANDPNDSQISYDTNTGKVTRVDVKFVNASSIKTDGVDLNLSYTLSASHGIYFLNMQTSWIRSYDLKETIGSETIDAVGNRNGLNIARSLPAWRTNFSINWLHNRHSATLATHYVDQYQDDANNNASIKQNITHDLQYSYELPYLGRWQTNITMGTLNILDTDPPEVASVLGYDTKIHDPRGRVFYARMTARY